MDIEGYDLSFFTSAGYDSPMTLWNRRNEVMFQKLQKHLCQCLLLTLRYKICLIVGGGWGLVIQAI